MTGSPRRRCQRPQPRERAHRSNWSADPHMAIARSRSVNSAVGHRAVERPGYALPPPHGLQQADIFGGRNQMIAAAVPGRRERPGFPIARAPRRRTPRRPVRCMRPSRRPHPAVLSGFSAIWSEPRRLFLKTARGPLRLPQAVVVQRGQNHDRCLVRAPHHRRQPVHRGLNGPSRWSSMTNRQRLLDAPGKEQSPHRLGRDRLSGRLVSSVPAGGSSLIVGRFAETSSWCTIPYAAAIRRRTDRSATRSPLSRRRSSPAATGRYSRTSGAGDQDDPISAPEPTEPTVR